MDSADALLQVYEERAFDLAIENQRQIQERISSGHSDRCTMCDRPDGKLEPGEISLSAELHEVPCRDCGDPILFACYYATITKHSKFSYRRIETLHTGHQSCSLQLVYRPTNDSLLADNTFSTEISREVRTRVEEHHVSYAPEITLPLCKPCHSDIHSKDKYRGFQPNMKRIEWEEY